MRRAVLPLLLVSLSVTHLASAAEIYNETTNGDLSGTGLSPTLLSVGLGSNTVTATTVAGDRDYFTITVPAGRRLNALVITSTTATRSFLGMQQGPQVTVSPTSGDPTGLLGWSHFGSLEALSVGVDLLAPRMRDSLHLFTPPLPAGTYSFWAQETGGTAITYTLDFQIAAEPLPPRAPVPPAFGGILALGLCGLGFWQIRRRSRAGA
jgi:hypothetical protein